MTERHPDLGDPEVSTQINHVLAQAEAERKKREHAEKYPLCTRLAARRSERILVQDFLEEMRSQGYRLAERVGPEELLEPVSSFDTVWLEYLEIDPNELEAERQAMLEEQREMNKKGASE